MTREWIHALHRRRAMTAWAVLTNGVEMLRQAPNIHGQQHGRCYLCPDPLCADAGRGPLSRTRDHVFPRRLRFKGDMNILLAHAACNQAKGDRWPYPCEVIYLAAIYMPAVNHRMVVAMRLARMRSAERTARVEALLA